MAYVQQAIDLLHVAFHPAGKLGFGDFLRSHGLVELDLGRSQAWQRDDGFALGRLRDCLPVGDAAGDQGFESVDCVKQRIFPGFPVGGEVGEIGRGDEEGVVVVRGEVDRVSQQFSTPRLLQSELFLDGVDQAGSKFLAAPVHRDFAPPLAAPYHQVSAAGLGFEGAALLFEPAFEFRRVHESNTHDRSVKFKESATNVLSFLS